MSAKSKSVWGIILKSIVGTVVKFRHYESIGRLSR